MSIEAVNLPRFIASCDRCGRTIRTSPYMMEPEKQPPLYYLTFDDARTELVRMGWLGPDDVPGDDFVVCVPCRKAVAAEVEG